MLQVKNLHASANGKPILRGIDFSVNEGEVHAVMGPNGSGKSTLAQVIAGHPAYEVTDGQVLYDGKDLLEMQPEERAQAGVFLAFQYPVEIPGVSNSYFLRTSYNEIRKIGEDQIFYCKQRGLSAEHAISLIVSGFCREVFKELPMEFALEAQQLLGITLEGSVG